MEQHKKYMLRCIQLASNGLGNTYPNPIVGSVIVNNNKIIGEGYHTKAGTNHAEINAINSVKDKSLLKESTLYVNLEPCSHFGKTPPCSVKIAELKIPKVVIGTIDTTEKVSGKGIKIMQNAGIEVISGVLNNECRKINKRFFTFHEKKRPYIILKWAQTSDGFIDILRNETTEQKPKWISGPTERTLVHKWRANEQAIMVGKNTVIFDNPELTTRNWYGKNPLRIIIDNNLQLVKNLNVFNTSAKTAVINSITHKQVSNTISLIKVSSKNSIYEQIFSFLYNSEIQSIIIEGGQKLLQSFIDNNLWDEARVFVGHNFFYQGIKAPELKKSNLTRKQKFCKSTLLFFENNSII
ncbi:MAG: bifunctional diaminohydroxyphosphoribosylaminopyrimidine deaminase/5-amino-6-(5-phosphoribosylamino)uracil reductase RibD [Bacteroidales bacterium]|nr:bifunctional diaminohydroxyphosphoribosylaminopyrimidine deaminase/5-amino-6-(5-phosphoribosylamino)uracil reductase RibD [Bacteroidales bacterium]